jgi:hypothetical protein
LVLIQFCATSELFRFQPETIARGFISTIQRAIDELDDRNTYEKLPQVKRLSS